MIAKKETHVRVQPIASSDRSEDRLVLALEEYSSSVEAGQPLSRESILAKYSDVADELSNCLDSLEFIREVAPQLGDDAANGSRAVSEFRPHATIGDFLIVRELGRGGMGVVYEAEQISLDRHVALKVLPFAAMLDKQQLARFKNEARAAATLDHPNIVAIHSVGSERGVHYYAMQLIEGRSLAEIIANMKPGRPPSHDETAQGAALINHATAADTAKAALPTVRATGSVAFFTIPPFESREYYRTIARLGVQAAEALDHAHQNGILHRDIKPANLLVDDTGKLWITDFGLARIERDAGMTMTGDILGTLRYMSPEQALAKRSVVDHRSDIYSLGATLYELLTLQPCFAAEDRAELLRQIAFSEPSRARRIQSRIPVDLETIVHKAIEKYPADRYATARELAEDLSRFIAEEPIKARPVRLLHRAAKWSRRHLLVVWVALAAAVLIAIAFGTSTALIGAAWQNTRLSERAAQDQLLNARRNLYRANVQVASQDWTEGNVAAVDRLLNEVVPKATEQDLRGWEWFYLKSLCRSEERSEPGQIVNGSRSSVVPLLTTRNGDTALVRPLLSHDVVLRFPAVDRQFFVVSRDGRRIVACNASWYSDRSVIDVWDIKNRERRSRIEFDKGTTAVALSPDASQMAIAQNPEQVNVWNAENAEKTLRLVGLEGIGVASLAWSPDGRFIAAGGNDGAKGLMQLAICDAKTGKLVRRLSGHRGQVQLLEYSPDGHKLASGSWDQTLKIWNVDSGALEQTIKAHKGWVNAAAWKPDGKRLASGGGDGVIRIWDVATGLPVNTLVGHKDAIGDMIWQDDDNLVSSASDGTKLWKPAKHQRCIQIGANAAHAWLPSSRKLITWHSNSGKIRFEQQTLRENAVVETTSLAKIDLPTDPDRVLEVASIALNPTGELLAVAPAPKGLEIWKLSTQQRVLAFGDSVKPVTCVAWSPDGNMLATAAPRDYCNIWDAATGQKLATLDVGRGAVVGSPVWSPDGTRLATITWRGDVRVWDVKGWTYTQLSQDNGTWSTERAGIAWSPNGDRLATKYVGQINIWDARTGNQLLSFRAHVVNIKSVAWNPDGSRLATGSQDHTIKIWNVNTGEELLTLQDDDDNEVNSLSWSPDGEILASTGGLTMKLWSATAAYERHR